MEAPLADLRVYYPADGGKGQRHVLFAFAPSVDRGLRIAVVIGTKRDRPDEICGCCDATVSGWVSARHMAETFSATYSNRWSLAKEAPCRRFDAVVGNCRRTTGGRRCQRS